MKWIHLALAMGWGALGIATFCGVLIPTPLSYGLACIYLVCTELEIFTHRS